MGGGERGKEGGGRQLWSFLVKAYDQQGKAFPSLLASRHATAAEKERRRKRTEEAAFEAASGRPGGGGLNGFAACCVDVYQKGGGGGGTSEAAAVCWLVHEKEELLVRARTAPEGKRGRRQKAQYCSSFFLQGSSTNTESE